MDLISNFTLQIEQLFLTERQKIEELKAECLNDHLLVSNEQSIKNEPSFPIINQLSEDFEQKFREERDSHLQTKEVNQELIERLKADNGALLAQMDETKTALEEMKVSHQKLLEKYNKDVLTTQEMIEHLEIELEDEKEAHQMTISQMQANIPEKNKQEEPNKDLLKKIRISHQENMFEDKLLYAKQKAEHFEKAFQKEFQEHQITKTKLEDLSSKMTQQCVAQQTSFQETEPQLGQAEGFENEIKKQIQAHEQKKTKCEDLDSTVCEQCVWHEQRFIRIEKEMRQKRLEERNLLLDEKKRCESELVLAKRQVEEIENELKKEIQAHEQTKTKCKDLDSRVSEKCVWYEQRFIRIEKEMRQKRLEERNLLLDEKKRCESELVLAKRQVEEIENELKKEIQAHEQTKTKCKDLDSTECKQCVWHDRRFIRMEKEMRQKRLEERNLLLDEKKRCESEIISAKEQVEGLEKELEKQIQAHEQTKTKLENLSSEMTHEFVRQQKGFKLREKEMREKLLEEQNVLLDEVKQRHESEIISAKEQVEGLEKELEKQIQAHEQTKIKLENLSSEMTHEFVRQEKRFKLREKEMREKLLEEQNVLLDEVKQRHESEIISAKGQVAGLEKELEKQIQAHEQTKIKLENLSSEMTHEFVRQEKRFKLREKEMREKLLEEQNRLQVCNVSLEEMKRRYENDILSARQHVTTSQGNRRSQKTKCQIQ
ncbi:golgin subfamily A member 6-like protein 22 [Nothobranchius furzeri]|uniref:golgin subfamily A member 6-like protein 22 n=1 Tax=Nothobranchius furzeri TaxID=105023 RepID=UPI00390462E1